MRIDPSVVIPDSWRQGRNAMPTAVRIQSAVKEISGTVIAEGPRYVVQAKSTKAIGIRSAQSGVAVFENEPPGLGGNVPYVSKFEFLATRPLDAHAFATGGETSFSVPFDEVFPPFGFMNTRSVGYLAVPAAKVDAAGRNLVLALFLSGDSGLRPSLEKERLSVELRGERCSLVASRNGGLRFALTASCSGSFTPVSVSLEREPSYDLPLVDSGSWICREILAELTEAGSKEIEWRPAAASFSSFLFVFPTFPFPPDLQLLARTLGADTALAPRKFLQPKTFLKPFVAGESRAARQVFKLQVGGTADESRLSFE